MMENIYLQFLTEWVHGPEARKSSQIAIKMIKRLFKTGFKKENCMELINSSISLNTSDDMYATLDISVFDLYSGNLEIIKNGACSTFIKSKNNIRCLKCDSLPVGIINNMDLKLFMILFDELF